MVAFDSSVTPATSTTTRYYYDDQRVLLETDASGTEYDARYFVYGNYIDEVLLMADVDSGNAVTDGDYYYAHDHLYSVVALLDAAGTVVERYEYDAYGQATVYTNMADWLTASPTTQGASNYGNPYLFTGRRLDTMDTGSLTIYHYRARAYDPQTGRFMQRDPLGIDPSGGRQNSFVPLDQYAGSSNLYEYVSSKPLFYIDPQGLSMVYPGLPPNIIKPPYNPSPPRKPKPWLDINGCDMFVFCRDNENMMGPLKNFDHCFLVMDGLKGESPDWEADDAKSYSVWIDRSPGRIIEAGPNRTPCSCATCSDVRECITKGRTRAIGFGGGFGGMVDYVCGKNCQNAMAKTLNKCCLKSTWKPSYFIKEPYPWKSSY